MWLLLSMLFTACWCLNRDDPIAVIGGGPSGCITAHHLAEQGYTNIHLYEKNAKFGGSAITVNHEGKPYDMATIFVPSSTVRGFGTPEALRSLLRKTNTHLRPGLSMAAFYPTRPPVIEDFTPTLKGVPTKQIIDEFSRAWYELAKMDYCRQRGQDCVQCGVCAKYTESLEEFGVRKNLQSWVNLTAYVVDGLGGSPTRTRWAGISMEIGPYWLPTEMTRTLHFLNVTSADLPPTFPVKFRAVFDEYVRNGSVRWYQVERGFQHLFEPLVSASQTSGRVTTFLSSPVSSLKRVEGSWEVTVGPRKRVYSTVIMAIPPKEIARLVPARRVLMENSFATKWVDLALANMTATWLPPTQLGFWIWNGVQGSAMSGIPTNLPALYMRQHGDTNVLYMAASIESTRPSDVSWLTFRAVAQQLGITVGPQPIYFTRLNWPSLPFKNVGTWITQIPKIQGEDGMYYVCEPVSGTSVSSIADFLSRWVPEHFPKPGSQIPTEEPEEPESSHTAIFSASLVFLVLSLISHLI